MTVVALEGFIFVVLPSVGLQIGELCEGFLTAGVCTFVWSITGVDSVQDEKTRKGNDVSMDTWGLAQQASSRPLVPSHGSRSMRWVSRLQLL